MRLATLAIGLSAIALTASATAAPNIVQNGSFEALTKGYGQLGSNTDATGWNANGGYDFVYSTANIDTGVNGQYGNNTLWTANNGGLSLIPVSPFGGNFLALDGAFSVAALTQTLSTIAGHTYSVSFAYAGAQQKGFDSATTEAFTVSLGNQSFKTPVLSNANHGFTGWQLQSFTFTAETANDILSFLSNGTPNGVPPFSLLDGVSVVDTTKTPVPEAATIGLLGLGLGVVAVARRRK